MANTGWGNLSWSANEWGNLADTTVLVSNPNDIAYGNEGWNEATFGGSNNNLVLNLDSVSITTELNAIAEPSGQQLNSSTGSVEAFSLVTVPVSGRQLNISQGDESVDLNNIYSVNGNGLTSSVGTVDAFNEIGWGRDDWGTEAWGGSGIWAFVDVTGLGLTIDSGDKEAWGELAWGSNEWGGAYITEVDNITFAAATGNQLNVAEGIADPSPDAMAVGIGMTIGVGLGSVAADANVFINNSSGFNYNTFGDAQLSTAQKKFGTASLALDGSGDYITSTQNCSYLASDFTLEFFIYSSAITTSQAFLIDTRDAFASNGIYVRFLNTGNIYIGYNTTNVLNVAHGMSNDTWHHVALTRSGSTWTVFIDGTLKQSATGSSSSFASRPFRFGGSGIYYLNGYLDEFRASNTARYTSSFDVPDSPFEPDGATSSLLHFDGANGSTTITDSIGEYALDLGLAQGQAELDAVSFIEVGGLSIGTFSIGSPVVGASAEVDLTGNQVNIALGNEVSQIWRIVDTGTSVSYTEVSTGSTVTWNNVDTAA